MMRLLLALLLLLPLLSAPSEAASREDRQAALGLIGQGVASFQAGDILAATRHWTEAIRLCRVAGVPQLEAEALARRAEAHRIEGHMRAAADDMSAALARARVANDAYLVAAAGGALGNLHFVQRRTATAEPLLLESHAGARRLGEAGLAAASANDLGNLYAATERPAEAERAYGEAIQLAVRAGDAALAATAETNAARLALERGAGERAAGLLRSAAARLGGLEPSYPVGMALVALGHAASARGTPSPTLALVAMQAAETARAMAERLGNPALDSMAQGLLGSLHERAGRLDAAGRATRQALLRARQAQAPDLAFRWEWQQARIDRALGQVDAALAGYRRAVAALQSVRQDIPVEYRAGASSFRSDFGELYTQYADLLLRRAARGGRDAAPLLREARDVLELLKQRELQDYFRDPCVAEFQARQRGVETVAADTAVIYPVVLPDRVELLISIGEEQRQVMLPVPETRLRAEAGLFRLLLERRATNEYLDPAQRLYELLIRPVEALLAGRGVKTLVIVPDGVLRTIPFAALHDGEGFLIERYAVAVVPGLSLVDSRPLPEEGRRALAAGLSVPRDGFPPLPNVASELENVRRLERGTVLLDSAFRKARFAGELRSTNYNLVHIASHAQFGGDPSQSFILAYDGRLTLDELEDNIKLARFREEPLELLVLSACQTAAGDDRAALGLAGLAVKAGARSALATLWFVNDETSGLLTVGFHGRLRSGFSKARALQAAQQEMVADPLLGHPAYWAPFILLGNWR